MRKKKLLSLLSHEPVINELNNDPPKCDTHNMKMKTFLLLTSKLAKKSHYVLKILENTK